MTAVTVVKIPTITDVRAFIDDNTWLACHIHLYEWLEIDWGIYAWICSCGEIESLR
jgi:hypothetical protein